MPLLVTFQWKARRQGPESVRGKVYPVIRLWGKSVCRLAGARLERIDHSDAAPGEVMLIVSNHQADFDIPLLAGYAGRSCGFVAKKELANLPLLSRWMRLTGCIFLDREDKRKQVAQVRETIETLKQGQSMVIFPEGTRSGSDELGPFAKGSLNIAQKAGVRIQPVTLQGTWKLKTKGKMLFPGGKVRMVLHSAIDPKALSAEELARLHDLVRDRIRSGLLESE
ncbi:MAG: 1-acyl-sn-glycerol-3-phosphate acyltransferase [Kiritimatiellae bacterium]|nr:1-acyl-sn-glycerol-3-phosphate acyltransferase [Kiritimatiellia bacterium]